MLNGSSHSEDEHVRMVIGTKSKILAIESDRYGFLGQYQKKLHLIRENTETSGRVTSEGSLSQDVSNINSVSLIIKPYQQINVTDVWYFKMYDQLLEIKKKKIVPNIEMLTWMHIFSALFNLWYKSFQIDKLTNKPQYNVC